MARHWIFDLDGTLIDSHPLYESVFKEVARHFRADLSPSAWSELSHLTLPKFLEKYFAADHFEPAFQMVIDRSMARQSEIEVYAGVSEVLDHLQNTGCLLSLCTPRELKTTKGILEVTALERFFGQIITRDCVPETKPHPEGIQRLMISSQTTAGETIMVGDHPMDIEAARGAGVRAVSVGWNLFARQDLASLSDHHFASVLDFRDWVVNKMCRSHEIL